MTAHVRRVALVTDNDPSRKALNALLQQSHHTVAACINVSRGEQDLADYIAEHHDQGLDIWLVDISSQHNESILDLLCDRSEKPMLLNDELPAAHDNALQGLWQKRLLEKLESICIEDEAEHSLGKPVAEHVWVLAASLGGPEMVKRFLSALPGGLAVAFVYVQHIAANFDHYLTGGIGNNQAYPLRLIHSEQKLIAGETLVVPADRQLRFLAFGEVVKTRHGWEGPYQPSIDQVVSELAKQYRKKMGVIIFSGTCNDGEIGCRVVRGSGGKVWAQTPATCVSGAMPEAAIKTGCVSFQGSPEQLAIQFATLIQQPVVSERL